MKLISFISLTLFLTVLNSICFAQEPKQVPTPNTECTASDGRQIPSGQIYTDAYGKKYMCQNGRLVPMK
jgi:hypothetical protein